MEFDPELLRNESEVESKLIVQYLLPALGYRPEDWYQEVAFGNIRLDFLAFALQNQPFKIDVNSPLALTIEVKSPHRKLDGFERRLQQYLVLLQTRYGVLTNGRDFRIYCWTGQTLKLIFRCRGSAIADRIERIRSIIGYEFARSSLPPELRNQPSTGYSRQSGLQPSVSEPIQKMMKVIAIYHNKGGVGKTTVTMNLAAGLRRKGYKVLLIDLDSQANSTFAAGLIKFQFEEDDTLKDSNVTHVLKSNDFGQIQEIVRQSEGFNTPEIDVLPSHIDLIGQEKFLESISTVKSRLLRKLHKVKQDYNFVIIDTPPSRNLYAQVGMIASDYLIIPSDLKPFANQGLSSVMSFLDEINEYRESMNYLPCQLLGVLPSKIQTNARFLSSTFPRQRAAITERHKLQIMDTVIYERIALSKSVNQSVIEGNFEIPSPQSIFDFADCDPSANQSASEFEALVEEVLVKVKGS